MAPQEAAAGSAAFAFLATRSSATLATAAALRGEKDIGSTEILGEAVWG